MSVKKSTRRVHLIEGRMVNLVLIAALDNFIGYYARIALYQRIFREHNDRVTVLGIGYP
ncbi:MAG: hypothetical protein ACI8SJ_002061 [Shewanella sp.]|jgi:hypothetical protein